MKPFKEQSIQIGIKKPEKNQSSSGVVFDLDAIEPNAIEIWNFKWCNLMIQWLLKNINDNFRNFSRKIVIITIFVKILFLRKPFLRNEFWKIFKNLIWWRYLQRCEMLRRKLFRLKRIPKSFPIAWGLRIKLLKVPCSGTAVVKSWNTWPATVPVSAKSWSKSKPI